MGIGAPLLADPVFSAVNDFSTTSNTSTDSWSYRYKTNGTRNGNYPLLSQFNASNSSPPGFSPGPVPGAWDAGFWVAPSVGVNSTGFDQTGIFPNGGVFWPDGTMLVHPADCGLVVVSWLSQSDAIVDIDFSFDDADPAGGDGVAWFVELNDGSNTLASGMIQNGGAGTGILSLNNISVGIGDRVNFVVDAYHTFYHDSTLLSATISSANPASQTTHTPEPTSIVIWSLLAVGCVGYGYRRRRMQSGRAKPTSS